MSASYWESTQRQKWQYTRESLFRERHQLWLMECQLFPQGLTVTMENNKADGEAVTRNIPITHVDLHYGKDYNLRIYCYFLIMKLGRRLNIRQYALATAHVYLARFLLCASVREVNLYLLVTTCIYLACKVEECPQHIRALVNEARSLWPEFVPPDPTKVTEFEFYLLEELQSYLIVHHPYRSMEQIVSALRSEPYGLVLSATDLQNCWSLINDSYITDLHLLVPPHVIAMASMLIIVSLQRSQRPSLQETFNSFMAQSQVDLAEVMDTIQDLITMYDYWDKYNEPWVKFLLHSLYLRST
ncbi:cyclin-dependent protein serine/threonine kinase regulator SSN8 [Lachancea thermotolerans CBS 6340]|uniref:RNA polymerase II holoenzyme cyclin-like subunit n=1 Tax=Lachancea thermotolerans (strain ATCC 56472 / CBS 6340 / NRRL Y-8284) TaxID=559295 RepID=C5DMP4_LACTC|nr:KLTH0G10560p [Lachancea thermotolerans CBS 6340]CAR25055.1 KLTH0G10560p [Lachancea thermotolerans CBS 6340]